MNESEVLRSADATPIAERFGLGEVATLDGPLDNGASGSIWRLQTDHGQWAVKALYECPERVATEAILAFERDMIRAGVPLPHPVLTTDGEVIAPHRNTWVRVVEWTELESATRLLDPEEVGLVLARMHRAASPHPGPVEEWYTTGVGADRWDRLLAASKAGGASFVPEFETLRDELVALEGLLHAPTEMHWCHRDLFADNLRRTAEGGLCVIDWDNSGPADFTQELAGVLVEFGAADLDRVRRINAAYREAGGPGRVATPADFSMTIAQLWKITAEAIERWLAADPADPCGPRDEGLAAELFNDPLTAVGIDAMLDAVGGRELGQP